MPRDNVHRYPSVGDDGAPPERSTMAMMCEQPNAQRPKPKTGHKCRGLQRWVEVRCECGWRSDLLRPAEQAAVYEQWRNHAAGCEQAQR